MLGDPMRIALALLLAPALAAQGPDLLQLPMEARLSWQTLAMPAPGERMGLLGLEFLREFDHGLAWGLSGYGALRGIRGGFITVGLSGAWRPALTERLHLDVGGFCGGGGAGRAAVGGGWMVEGHAGLDWRADAWRLGAAYERIRFPNGDVDSSQWRLSLGVPFGLKRAGFQGTLNLANMPWREAEVAFTKARYQPRAGLRLDGQPERPVDLVGLWVALELNEGPFACLELAGAHRGGADGYMEGLVGLGWRWHLDEGGRWRIHARLAGGPAGGGRLDVGGGMAWKGALGIEAALGPSTFLSLEGGRIAMPGGSYQANTWQLALGRRLGLAMDGGRRSLPSDLFANQPWNVESGVAELAHAARGPGREPNPVRLASLRLGLPISNLVYVVGEAAFGTSGSAGGYAEGLAGVGCETNPLPRFGTSFFAELSLGAAGGGGIETRGGAVIQPTLGLHQILARNLDLSLRFGRTRALRGGLDSSMLALGLRWRTGLLARRSPN